MNKELLKGNSELIILSSLARRPMHGYALSEWIKEQMPESFKFGVGMIYPLLHRLEQKKLIKGEWRSVEGLERRVYSLTKQGKKILEAKKVEWKMFHSLVIKIVNQPS